jgi:ABC-type Fe3+-hydroxamate transport system substrate-binding protein
MWRRVAVLAVLAVTLAFPAGVRAEPARRIVSLAPVTTEMLYALGAGPRIVGVSEYSDYPAAAARLPVVATYATVDAERIVRLHPDLIVGIASQDAQVRDLRRAGLDVRLLRDDALDDVAPNISALGRWTGEERAAAALNASLSSQTAALRREVRPKRGGAVPSVFVVLQVSPIFTVGNRSYIAQLIAMAGGRNASASLHDAYGRFSEEALVRLQPDVIVADEQSGIRAALQRAPWNALAAVKQHHVYVLGDAAILERPGPRYPQGLRWLIDRLNDCCAK